MKTIAKTAAIGSLLLSSIAVAGGPPSPGALHDPPRVVDETTSMLNISTRGSKNYSINVEAEVSGFTNKRDTFRLDWMQGGKVLTSAPCRTEGRPGPAGIAIVHCKLGDKPQHAAGAIDAELIYIDDSDSKEYLVRDFKVTAKKWASAGDEVWQIVPDDLLAAGYVKHWDNGNQGRDDRPNFIFWSAYHGGAANLVFRCTVDGTKLDDLEGTISSAWTNGQQVEFVPHTAAGVSTEYHWEHIAAIPRQLRFGAKNDEHGKADQLVWLIDHPGQWMCQLRSDAHPFREFRFKVNDKGLIESDDLQSGKGAVPLPDSVALIDLRIPKGETFDTRVRPDAIKKSMGFGLPWPDHAHVKAIHASLPPASGLPDPR